MGRTSLAVMFALLALNGCGRGGQTTGSDDFRGHDITAKFVREAPGSFRDDDTGQILSFGQEGAMQYLTLTPSSSLDCSFVIAGKVRKVIQRNETDRVNIVNEATHLLEWEQKEIKADNSLEASSERNSRCVQFIKTESQNLPRTSLMYFRWTGKQLQLIQSDGLMVDEIYSKLGDVPSPYERKTYSCSVELFKRDTSVEDAFESSGALTSLPICIKRRTLTSQESLLPFYTESDNSSLLLSYNLNTVRGQEGLSVELYRAVYPEDGSPMEPVLLDRYEAGVALLFRDVDKYKIKLACRFARSCRQSTLR